MCRASIVSLGASRLETIRLAIANADQRRGRAGRTGPGVCYRLWREAEMRGFAASPSPEIDNADLTGLALDLARWGAKSPADLRWLNPPREAAWRPARALLVAGGAMTPDGELTSLGNRLGDLALPPRLALMVLRAAEHGAGKACRRNRSRDERARPRRPLGRSRRSPRALPERERPARQGDARSGDALGESGRRQGEQRRSRPRQSSRWGFPNASPG